MMHEERDVSCALTKRRHLDGENAQPVIEVAPELVVCDHPFQITMGRRDQPRVDLLCPRAPQALEFTLLQDTQELGLEFQGDVTDLVQKQRALVGQLHPADLLRDRAGEGTPLVPKQLTLEQTAGNGSAIQLHAWAIVARADVVNRFRDQLLASARFSLDQYGGIS